MHDDSFTGTKKAPFDVKADSNKQPIGGRAKATCRYRVDAWLYSVTHEKEIPFEDYQQNLLSRKLQFACKACVVHSFGPLLIRTFT